MFVVVVVVVVVIVVVDGGWDAYLNGEMYAD